MSRADRMTDTRRQDQVPRRFTHRRLFVLVVAGLIFVAAPTLSFAVTCNARRTASSGAAAATQTTTSCTRPLGTRRDGSSACGPPTSAPTTTKHRSHGPPNTGLVDGAYEGPRIPRSGSVALSSGKIAASLSRETIGPSTYLAATAISVHGVPVPA